MSHDLDTILDKMATAYQPLSKTVSDLGDKVNKTNIGLAGIEMKMSDFIERIDKKMDSHDTSIKSLDEAKTTIFSSIATTKWVAGLLLTIIVTMGGFIVTSWSQSYDERISKIESEKKETLDKVLQLLSDKKNYLNYNEREMLKDIFANL